MIPAAILAPRGFGMDRRLIVLPAVAAIAAALSGCAGTQLAAAPPNLEGACVLIVDGQGKLRRADAAEARELAGVMRLETRDLDMVRAPGTRLVLHNRSAAREPACNASSGANLG
jgi:hypothetical protein